MKRRCGSHSSWNPSSRAESCDVWLMRARRVPSTSASSKWMAQELEDVEDVGFKCTCDAERERGVHSGDEPDREWPHVHEEVGQDGVGGVWPASDVLEDGVALGLDDVFCGCDGQKEINDDLVACHVEVGG